MLGFRRDSALISFYVVWTVSTRGVTVPNVVVGPALFYGGLAQLLAGSEYHSLSSHPVLASRYPY